MSNEPNWRVMTMAKDKTSTTRDEPAQSINDVFSRLEKGELTSEQADAALNKIRQRDHTWLERHVIPSSS
jgi:hypothetical protein